MGEGSVVAPNVHGALCPPPLPLSSPSPTPPRHTAGPSLHSMHIKQSQRYLQHALALPLEMKEDLYRGAKPGDRSKGTQARTSQCSRACDCAKHDVSPLLSNESRVCVC